MIFRRTQNITKSLIRQMYEKAGGDSIDMSIGMPYLKTPKQVKLSAINAINDDKTFYTENRGISRLRKLIAKKFNKNHSTEIDEDFITVHVGSTEALFSVMFSTVMPGDSVLLPDPGYPAYESVAKMLGAKIVRYTSALGENESEYESIKTLYNKNIRLIIINSPANPTGRVIPENELKKIADFLADKDVFVISDEIYSDIVYSEKFISIADFLPLEKCAVISGVSKSYGMTGWRIGWSISSESNAKEINKSHMYTVSCAPSISQYAAIEAISNEKSENYVLPAMRENREFAISALSSIKNIRILPSEGSIFLFIDVSKYGTGEEIAFALLEKEKVITVPGIGFGKRGEDYIRISFGMEPQILKEGLKRIQRFFRNLL
ncbi:MAG: aminotransferase class I/II-fold pyridoxal phosphate-dependent enzyme [Proteobacteria bacterium]|nr:aminotransferase class I/II-fold pyridoxal phosphate-dependent enzyme [Pseudomonadota bacterium]